MIRSCCVSHEWQYIDRTRSTLPHAGHVLGNLFFSIPI